MKRIFSLLTFSCALAGCGQNDTTQTTNTEANAPATAQVREAAVTPAPQAPARPYQELVADADKAIAAKDLEQAVKLLTQAISQDSTRVEAFVRRAAIFAEAKLLPRAVNDMTAAIKIEPDRAKYKNTRGYYLLLLKKFEAADQDFNDAIGLDLHYPQPYNNRGLLSIARGKMEQAVQDFENAIRIDAKYIDAHNNRGFALMQLNRDEEAVQSLSQALEINPEYINAISNRARAYLKLNRPLDAVSDFTKAIELQPDHLQLYSYREQAYVAAGKYSEAAHDADHVAWTKKLNGLSQQITRTRNDANLWTALGRHLLLKARNDEAIKAFSNALELDPKQQQALLGRAAISLHRGECEKTIADCTQALTISPSTEAISMRGDAAAELGRWDEAIADFQAARRIDSRVVTAYRKRAESRRSAGDENQAREDESFANSLEKQLSEGPALQTAEGPRVMVVQPVSHEEAAPAVKAE